MIARLYNPTITCVILIGLAAALPFIYWKLLSAQILQIFVCISKNCENFASLRMANLKINNLQAKIVAIQNEVQEGRYNTEDILPIEKAYILKHAAKERSPRTDLQNGNVVVVLEGMHMGRRAIFVQQAPEYMAIVFCISHAGTPMFFKIDERYLLKLSVSVKIPSLALDASTLIESVRGEGETLELEASDAEKAAASKVVDAISQVKYMKTYLTEDFKIDQDVEFYSQQY